MARAHYIVRVGNQGFATTFSSRAPNHWHYLSPRHLWGLPKGMTHVNVRAEFMADIENPRVTTYIWFLCNSHDGPSHFVQVGIGRRCLGQGPVGDGNPPIPEDVMARLRQGFDHWFGWRPVTLSADFREQLHQLPVPQPTFIPTLRRVTAEHPSFPLFQALINSEEQQAAATTTAEQPSFPLFQALNDGEEQQAAATTTTLPAAAAIEVDFENLRREQTEPSSEGYVYLIHMEGTTFYKIGMSLDPQLRLRTLQTGNPYTLHILNTQAVQDMRSAESSLHRRFQAHRVPNLNAREWFNFGNGTGEVETAFSIL